MDERQGVYAFLSWESVQKHKALPDRYRLLCSVLAKEDPRLAEVDLFSIPGLSMPRARKREAVATWSVVRAHDLFFSSFSTRGMACPPVRALYGTEGSFLYRLKGEAMVHDNCFLFLCRDRFFGAVFDQTPPKTAVLAVDLFEHAYYPDYGFDKERYIDMALAYLDLSKLI